MPKLGVLKSLTVATLDAAPERSAQDVLITFVYHPAHSQLSASQCPDACAMSNFDGLPHSCVACASRLLFSFGSCPRKGTMQTIDDNGAQVYIFNLKYAEALVQANRGCEFMEWLVSLPTTGRGCRLQAHISVTPSGPLATQLFAGISHLPNRPSVSGLVSQLRAALSQAHINGGIQLFFAWAHAPEYHNFAGSKAFTVCASEG